MTKWKHPLGLKKWEAKLAYSTPAIADRNPTGGDVKQAPSRSDESGGAETAIAQPQTPIARGG